HGKTLLDMLGQHMTNDKIAFSRTRSTQYQYRTKGINDVDPAPAFLLFQLVLCGQIDAKFIFQQAFFLWKGFILSIENIIFQTVFNNTGKQGTPTENSHKPNAAHCHISDRNDVKISRNIKDQTTQKV